MLTPLKAFKYWWGIHLHFTSESYSVLTYGQNTKSAQNKFDSMSPEQKSRFEWICTKFVFAQEVVYASIGCQFSSIDIRYSQKSDIIKAYQKYKSRKEGLSYALKLDMTKYETAGHPKLNTILLEYLSGSYSPEFVLIIDSFENSLQSFYTNRNYVWCRSEILKLIKYRNFFSPKPHQSLVQHQYDIETSTA